MRPEAAPGDRSLHHSFTPSYWREKGDLRLICAGVGGGGVLLLREQLILFLSVKLVDWLTDGPFDWQTHGRVDKL